MATNLGPGLSAWDDVGQVRTARAGLEVKCAREAEARRALNSVQSEAQCSAAEAACQDVLEREQRGALPSTGACSMNSLELKFGYVW